MFGKNKVKKELAAVSENMFDTHIIGDKNAFLIVSELGHFDFRVNQKSVFGRIFDEKDKSFVGNSPVFVLLVKDKRVNFKFDRVESDFGCIKLISSRITLCFTVDTHRKELLAKTVKAGGMKEYILCVSGQRIAVNSVSFERISQGLRKATLSKRQRFGLSAENDYVQRMYLWACFWSIASNERLTYCWQVHEYKRFMNRKNALCITFPEEFSTKVLEFSQSILGYSRYLYTTFELGRELVFFDPKGKYATFLAKERLKIYSKKEFELLKVYSCGVICLDVEKNPEDIWNEQLFMQEDCKKNISKAFVIKKSESDVLIRMGAMSARLSEYGIAGIDFMIKNSDRLEILSPNLIIKNNDIVSKPIELKSKTIDRMGAVYEVLENEYLSSIMVCFDKKLPCLLVYAEKTSEICDISIRFSMRTLGVELSQRTVRISNINCASVVTPLIYEHEALRVFIIKKEDFRGVSFVIGAFTRSNDALLYKAMQNYQDIEVVRTRIKKVADERKERASGFSCELCSFAWDDPSQRLKNAIDVCSKDHIKAKFYIIWALCYQNIDGNLYCKESAALALCKYIEKSNDYDILYLELPYNFQGKFTSRRENVFMHVMRSAEVPCNNEDKQSLEFLKSLYYKLK